MQGLFLDYKVWNRNNAADIPIKKAPNEMPAAKILFCWKSLMVNALFIPAKSKFKMIKVVINKFIFFSYEICQASRIFCFSEFGPWFLLSFALLMLRYNFTLQGVTLPKIYAQNVTPPYPSDGEEYIDDRIARLLGELIPIITVGLSKFVAEKSVNFHLSGWLSKLEIISSNNLSGGFSFISFSFLGWF